VDVRSDATLNREKILEATQRLVATRGAGGLTIAGVAEGAGVGKATVIRRFGDKAALISALLGEQERRLQEELIRGKPPLGPGAPALERIEAFLRALARLYLDELELVYASETAAPGARYRNGAYAAWRQHVALLVRDARPDLDPELVAHLLLAPLAAESLAELRRLRKARALPEAMRRVVRGVLG
jgi:AcrR family transcriptional regulator